MRLIYLSFILFAGLATQAFALDHLIISQVLYDPIKTETGGEAIEVYNPTLKDISLTRYTIKTKTSNTDVIFQNATVKSKGFYLVADAGWSTGKDNESYPNADYEDTFTLVNSEGGLALVYNGTIVDAVGWGNGSLDSSLYEGTMTKIVKEGNSIKRIDLNQDTNNNSFDFVESFPGLRNSSSVYIDNENDAEIGINVSVKNSAPVIGGIEIEDDLDEGGIQIIPNIDSLRNVKFNVSFNDPDGADDFSKMEAVFNGHKIIYNQTQGIIAFESYDNAGNYSLDITVYDKSNASANYSLKIEYQELNAISLDVKNINLDVNANDNITIEGDKDMGTTDKPTIKNAGNIKLNLGAISSGIETLPFDNVDFSINGIRNTLTSDLNIVNTSLKPGQTTDVSLYFSVGDSLKRGNYYGKVVIVGVPA